MTQILLTFALIFPLCAANLSLFACTTFVLAGGQRVYLGKNLDWDWDSGMVIVNSRHVHKRAFVLATNAVEWTSKYGSITLNQFGRELPFGGMNEKGLVVENMWLSETKYPNPDPRPEINMLQWIQFQLDTCATVAEVVETDKRIRLENTPILARIHYLVADAQGDCAVVEFVNGKSIVRRGKNLPLHALANGIYDQDATYLRSHPHPQKGEDSVLRFCRAAVRATEFKPGKNSAQDVDYAFETLENVRQGNYTAWQVVYDISGRQVHFRTRTNPQRRSVGLANLDFACAHPPRYVDIQADPSKNGQLEFHDLRDAEQRDYVTRFVSQDSVKKEVGDLSPIMPLWLMALHTYSCGE